MNGPSESILSKLIEHELEVASFNIKSLGKDKAYVVFNKGRIAELRFLAEELGLSVTEYQPGAFDVKPKSSLAMETLLKQVEDLEHRIKALDARMESSIKRLGAVEREMTA